MSDLKIGSLFSGYGGLDMAVESVTGARTAWVSDIDKGACKILAHRYPDVPNLGDLTQIDWDIIEPVDIITGGFPCQDLSHAGKRAGMTSESRSGLWSYMCDAINIIRPRLVVAENVRGLLSAEALRPVEPCTWCVGDEPEFDVRALGTVLADLADIGYDAQWVGLRAADVGACHGRFRVFLVASPQEFRLGSGNVQVRNREAQPVTGSDRASAGLKLLGTPTARMWKGSGPVGSTSHKWLLDHGNVEAQVLSLLPTPAVNDMGAGKTVDDWDAWTDKMKAAHGNGNGHGASLSIEALRLLPTPMVGDAKSARNSTATRHKIPPTGIHAGDTLTDSVVPIAGVVRDFGQYAAAITRWETVIRRPAPSPTEATGKGGAARLSPAFTEWMMGLPAGWITDVPGITRNEALKACGNGVVPQQAAAALRHMLAASEAAA